MKTIIELLSELSEAVTQLKTDRGRNPVLSDREAAIDTLLFVAEAVLHANTTLHTGIVDFREAGGVSYLREDEVLPLLVKMEMEIAEYKKEHQPLAKQLVDVSIENTRLKAELAYLKKVTRW